MTQINHPEEGRLGYWFYPPESAEAAGGNRLDVVITEAPTLAHFDPVKLTLNVKSEGNLLEHIKIVHPWDFNHSYQALTGIVEIIDRKGKKEEAFTFGGSLAIDSRENLTLCKLSSSAPILEMSKVGSLHMMLIEEIEILLAERSASLLAEHRVYEQHLLNADPFQLYLACLHTLIEKYEALNQIDETRVHEFRTFLLQERRRLRNAGLLPGQIPPLQQVL